MPRGSPSAADQELLDRLADRGLSVTVAQLERWRAAGLLPRHRRLWLGRGRGSASVLDEKVVEIAAALARHARQGRDLRWTVVGWYAAAGRSSVVGPAVPEPPWPAVHEALVWAVATSAVQRLIEQASAAAAAEQDGDERAQDNFYADAGRIMGRSTIAPPHPVEVRRVFTGEADELAPDRGADERRRSAVHLTAAAGGGIHQVGTDVLFDAVAALLPDLDVTGARDAARAAEEAGTFADITGPLPTDPLTQLRAAGQEEMARARHTAWQLAGTGGLYLMHGLLMPDTPALAGVRAHVDTYGLGPLLQLFAIWMITPARVPHVLDICLSPYVQTLGNHLETVLHTAAAEHGLVTSDTIPTAEAFTQQWLDNINTARLRATPPLPA